MREKKHIFFILIFFIILGLRRDDSKHTFVIKKDYPATGLTLAWLIPESKAQTIVGPNFKPLVKGGNALLMLFVVHTKKYYLDDNTYDNLNLAHIIVPVEGANAINSPYFMSTEKQKINDLLRNHGFNPEVGNIKLSTENKKDSIHIESSIFTNKGSIEIKGIFLNKISEVKYIGSTTVSAPGKPDRFFRGSESYKKVNIPKLSIKIKGETWISQLNLTPNPDIMWLNTNFVWDFLFN